MPHIKNALLRYRIIDKALRNSASPFPSKEKLRRLCEEALYGSDSGEHISDSTIEKDFFAMKMEHDAPIEYSRLDKGYYYSDDQYSLNDIPLTEDDINAIKFAADTLSQFKESSIFDQFGFALEKIIDRINTTDGNKNNEDQLVQFETGTKFGGNEHLEPLLKACKNQTITYFYYASFKKESGKKRKVIPLLLKEYRNRWYLISHDMVKRRIITYALDRIQELELTESTTNEKINFNPDRFFHHATGITTSEKPPEKVIFFASNIASKYIISQPFHKSQRVVEESEEGVTFELFVIVTEDLIREFLSYGKSIRVISPTELKTDIKNRLVEAVANYDKAG